MKDLGHVKQSLNSEDRFGYAVCRNKWSRENISIGQGRLGQKVVG